MLIISFPLNKLTYFFQECLENKSPKLPFKKAADQWLKLAIPFLSEIMLFETTSLQIVMTLRSGLISVSLTHSKWKRTLGLP